MRCTALRPSPSRPADLSSEGWASDEAYRIGAPRIDCTPSFITLGNFDVSARARAEKLASFPPLVKVPLNADFQPTRSPIQRTVSCSILEASCERANVASCGFRAATSASARTATYV